MLINARLFLTRKWCHSGALSVSDNISASSCVPLDNVCLQVTMHNSCGQVALHCSCLCCARTDSGSRSHSRTASSYCSFTEFLQFFKLLPSIKKNGIIQNMKGKVIHMQHFLLTRVTIVISLFLLTQIFNLWALM